MISLMTTPPKAVAADRKIESETRTWPIGRKRQRTGALTSVRWPTELTSETTQGLTPVPAGPDNTSGFSIDLLLHFGKFHTISKSMKALRAKLDSDRKSVV